MRSSVHLQRFEIFDPFDGEPLWRTRSALLAKLICTIYSWLYPDRPMLDWANENEGW